MKIRPIAEKSRCRHIRLAIKPRYLGNHASQIKSNFGILLRSHGRSFRFRHENLPEAPPSVEITMTVYPACNETSLSRKSMHPRQKVSMGRYQGSPGRSFRFRHENLPEAPPIVQLTMTSYPVAMKPRYLGNHAS